MICAKNVSTFPVCRSCNITCSRKNDWDRHLLTDKHKRNTKIDDSASKQIISFECTKCEYKCCKQSLWKKHCETNKHKDTLIDTGFPNTAQSHSCVKCNKKYDRYASCWAHSKKCSVVIETKSDNIQSEPEKDLYGIINKLLTDNQELRQFIMSQASDHKEMVNKVISISSQPSTVIHGNVNNNKFNINMFLSEQCKDAINFADFVKNIEVSREDIQNTGQLGFVDGISKILMDNLKQLSVNERPIHCTDLKRETMYIKDEDKWNKEENDSKIRNAIQTVSRKSMKTLIDWKQVNPDYEDGDSEFSQECLSMQRHSVAGDDREVYYPKVAKLVAKEVIIDKS